MKKKKCLVSAFMCMYSETCDERPLRWETDLWQNMTVVVKWPYMSVHLYLWWKTTCHIRTLCGSMGWSLVAGFTVLNWWLAFPWCPMIYATNTVHYSTPVSMLYIYIWKYAVSNVGTTVYFRKMWVGNCNTSNIYKNEMWPWEIYIPW